MADNTTYVYLFIGSGFVPAGILTVHQTGSRVASEFVYGRRYIERQDALPVDPVQLPLTRATFQTKGVFRGFEDASPDGWGRHLLDREAEVAGIKPTEFEYLTVQNQEYRIGAIAFGPDLNGPRPYMPKWRSEERAGEALDFSGMIRAVDQVLHHDELAPQYRRFLQRGSSVGGAQPKALVEYKGKKWIAKFSREMEIWPTCRIELAAVRLAARCGIRVPDCFVLKVGNRDVFLIERFDTTPEGYRKHFLSAKTLTGADDMQKGAYGDIAMAIRRFGVPEHVKDDLEELFRRMVFNICINNWDDHLQNHGFIADSKTRFWRLSPAYDIVPQPQRGGVDANRLTLSVGDQGRLATFENALSQAGEYGLSNDVALYIIKNMREIILKEWEAENKKVQVPKQKIALVKEAYRQILSSKDASALNGE